MWKVRGVSYYEDNWADHETGRSVKPVPRRPQPYLILGNRSLVTFEVVDARVDLVCSNDWFVSIPREEKTSWALSEVNCKEGGVKLAKDSYDRLAPHLRRKGDRGLEMPSRNDDGVPQDIPKVISPRYTALLEAPVEIRFTEVKDATAYEIGFFIVDDQQHRVRMEDLKCAHDNMSPSARRVCSYPWPEDFHLEPRELHYLTVKARIDIAQWSESSDPKNLLTVLDSEKAAEIRSRRDRIAALPEESRRLLEAGIARDAQLYSEAINEYRRILRHRQNPQDLLDLGDLYRAVELDGFALASYRAVLKLKGQPELKAAAHLGLGLAHFALKEDKEALRHAHRTLRLSRRHGWEDETALACRILEKLKEPCPR